MEDAYLGMLHDDPFAQYNYYGSEVYVNVPDASPGGSSAQFVHPYQGYVHPSQSSTSTSTGFTREARGRGVLFGIFGGGVPQIQTQFQTKTAISHTRFQT